MAALRGSWSAISDRRGFYRFRELRDQHVIEVRADCRGSTPPHHRGSIRSVSDEALGSSRRPCRLSSSEKRRRTTISAPVRPLTSLGPSMMMRATTAARATLSRRTIRRSPFIVRSQTCCSIAVGSPAVRVGSGAQVPVPVRGGRCALLRTLRMVSGSRFGAAGCRVPRSPLLHGGPLQSCGRWGYRCFLAHPRLVDDPGRPDREINALDRDVEDPPAERSVRREEARCQSGLRESWVTNPTAMPWVRQRPRWGVRRWSSRIAVRR